MDQDLVPALTCNTCHRRLPVKICKSDKNGNAGRAFTCCYKKHANHTRCEFFAWIDPNLSPPSSRFASSSPASSPALPLGQSTATQNPSSTSLSCSKIRCTTVRLHPACTRKMCRKHCLEAGGCQGTKTHLCDNTVTLASNKGKERETLSSLRLLPSPSSSPPPLATTSASTSTARDMFANPRYASQMTAAFTQQHAVHQAQEEKRRAVDAERLSNVEKAKNHVIIYAWPKDNIEATVFEVQGGFKWPLFPLTAAVLRDADLMLPGEEHVRFKKYNPCIHTWSKVPVGHIITLKPGEHIFLKGHDVTICQEFDRLLSASQRSPPHFFKNLPHERAHVRRALKEKKISQADDAMSSDDDDEVVVVEKCGSQAGSKTTARPPILSSRYNVEPLVLDLTVSDSRSTSRTSALPPHPVAKLEMTVIDLALSDAEDDIMPAPTRTKRARSSFSPTPTPCPSLDDSSDDSPPSVAWPADFYVVDIIKGFEKCDEARRGRRSMEKAFVKCFKLPFRSTTFYNHRRHWDNAPATIREAALHAGHTSAGLWTTFLDRARAQTVKPVNKRRKIKSDC